MKMILLGNAGAGKSTMAHRIIGEAAIRRLSLDEIAWDKGPKRKSLEVSLRLLHDFIQSHEEWIIEGCYSDLIEAALPYCTELRFLNPGVEVCVAHCLRRPWEPEKFSAPEDQAAMLSQLVEWVRQYETREDDYGLKRHREVFERFPGLKREYTSVDDYSDW
jgi:adenylate kinase family enzyme